MGPDEIRKAMSKSRSNQGLVHAVGARADRWKPQGGHPRPLHRSDPVGCEVEKLLVTIGGIMSVTGRMVPLAPNGADPATPSTDLVVALPRRRESLVSTDESTARFNSHEQTCVTPRGRRTVVR